MDKFKALKLNMQSVKDDILALQGASSTQTFDNTVAAISERYPRGISKGVGEEAVEESVCSYLRGIHPTDWSVVGGRQYDAYDRGIRVAVQVLGKRA
jgi:hypothetical protein